MTPQFKAPALNRAFAGTSRPEDVHHDALGRAALRANEARGNASQVSAPINTQGLPPAVAGRVAGGTPRFKDPRMIQQHLLGGPRRGN